MRALSATAACRCAARRGCSISPSKTSAACARRTQWRIRSGCEDRRRPASIGVAKRSASSAPRFGSARPQGTIAHRRQGETMPGRHRFGAGPSAPVDQLTDPPVARYLSWVEPRSRWRRDRASPAKLFRGSRSQAVRCLRHFAHRAARSASASVGPKMDEHNHRPLHEFSAL